ncbi:MAG: hypothetical protein D4R65_07505 [Verrucomicrobiaceae bacterium]|nr:MAG: hypothetical protein D4R65_07505 [Verrucomicrobiaceae bacterium]
MGEWSGYPMREIRATFLAAGGYGGSVFLLLGRLRSLEIRLIVQISAANPLPKISGFIGFYAVLSGSMSANEIWRKKPAEPLFMRFPFV